MSAQHVMENKQLLAGILQDSSDIPTARLHDVASEVADTPQPTHRLELFHALGLEDFTPVSENATRLHLATLHHGQGDFLTLKLQQSQSTTNKPRKQEVQCLPQLTAALRAMSKQSWEGAAGGDSSQLT